MRRRGRSIGFTLVELAVVVTVAGVALTATAGAVTSGAKLARTTAETRAACRSALSLMERIRATPFANIPTEFGDQKFSMSTTGGGESSGVSAVAVSSVYTGSSRWRVLKVTVTTQWKGSIGTSSQSMVTYICDRSDGSTLSTSRTEVPADPVETQ